MSVGRVEPFNLHKDNWNLYIDRLEQYFIVNDVKPAMQVATLITVIGSEAYELMVNLCTPSKPSVKSFNDLVDVMRKHLQPRPSVLAERFKFRQRKQKTGESVAEYVAELKKLTKDCGFSAETLSENLRDQFACGLRSDNIRQRLFTEEDIKFETAFKIAVTMEAAEADAALVEGGGTSMAEVSVNRQDIPWAERRRIIDPQRCHSQSAGRGNDAGMRSHNSLAAGASYPSGAIMNSRSGKKRLTYQGQAMTAVGVHCEVCGGRHNSNSCKFKKYVCRVCNREGHLKKVCPKLLSSFQTYNIHGKEVISTGNMDSDSDEVNHHSLSINKVDMFGPYTVNICVENVMLSMEIDTGSAISCISYDCYKKYLGHIEICKCDIVLRYYTGEIVRPVGKIKPLVKYKNKAESLDLYIIQSGKTNLLGRQWISELNIEIIPTGNYSIVKGLDFNLSDFSSRYCEVFSDGLGRFTGGQVGFQLRPDARPVFMRARPLAYALREPVERALEQLVRDGVIAPVSTSDWATPIVPVMKKDGTIRVCGDFKVTLNKCLEVDRFPLPRVEDLLAKLHGGNKFTKLDLSQAYAQFELDDSKKYTVINTHKGLFMYNRLIYGLASSPGIFQRKLEQIFGDMPRVGLFLDDVIITGEDDHSHLSTLHEVFRRLQKYDLKIKREKCTFFADSVTYLGFVINKDGVHTCPDKIDAIKNVNVPTNVSELRSFLGLVMYYARFVPNISTILAPLYTLLKKDIKFEWDDQCDRAFSCIKDLLVSSEILAHYSPDLPLVLTTDASSVGVGAVISHVTPQGERPIAYASRVLNAAEKSYSQIEKEGLAIVYGVKKFHQYLYGRKFTLRTDHKPLVTIFGDKAGIPIMAASRMQRWAILLAGYDYNIEYVRSNQNAADALSRLPVGAEKRVITESTYINFVQDFLPITKQTVLKHQNSDDVLQKVILYIQTGWPNKCEDEVLRPYFTRRNELFLDLGCVMWGYRLVIPSALVEYLLKELHVGHLGTVKMKSLARSVMWWPGIDADIERTCRECDTCAVENASPARAPPQPWPYIPEPWSRLHVDFLGPFHGKTFLVIIDSTSKWLEIFHMPTTTANAVIKVLRETFARFGLPREVVSDNGPPFTSREYSNFMTNNGIKLTYTAVYHPASNGAAEGAVKLCKRAIKKSLRDGCDLDASLQAYLMAYRNVEHGTTGVSPAQLLQRRSLRSRLDLLRGKEFVEERVHETRKRQMKYVKGSARNFREGENVWMRNYGEGNKWKKGKIESKIGSRNYLVGREGGLPIKRHVDQIKKRWFEMPLPKDTSTTSRDNSTPVTLPEPIVSAELGSSNLTENIPNDVQPAPTIQGVAAPRPSKRIRRPVIRYGLEID